MGGSGVELQARQGAGAGPGGSPPGSVGRPPAVRVARGARPRRSRSAPNAAKHAPAPTAPVTVRCRWTTTGWTTRGGPSKAASPARRRAVGSYAGPRRVGLAVAVRGCHLRQVYRPRHDGTQSDAIVVMGAAQYDGRPSPVLQARLDHALQLWEHGYAEMIIVTGGKQAGDRLTEATARYTTIGGGACPTRTS